MNCYVLLMMGGSGTRFGAELPKQFTDIDGKPLFTYISNRISKMDAIDGIVVVVNPVYLNQTRIWIQDYCPYKIISVVSGGAIRSESVFNGLKALTASAKSCLFSCSFIRCSSFCDSVICHRLYLFYIWS